MKDYNFEENDESVQPIKKLDRLGKRNLILTLASVIIWFDVA